LYKILFLSPAKDRVDIIFALFLEFSFAGAFGLLSRCARSISLLVVLVLLPSGFSFNSCSFKVSSRYESNSLDLKDRSMTEPVYRQIYCEWTLLLSGVERDLHYSAFKLFLFLLPFLLERSSASSSDIAFDRVNAGVRGAVKAGLKVSMVAAVL
jgi:hypothetical protein